MDNVLVPALVAAFVTLVIEYVAKPRLEARKERILERHRETRALLRLFGQVTFQMGQHAVVVTDPRDDEEDLVAALREATLDRMSAFAAAYTDAGPLSLTGLGEEAVAAFAADSLALIRARQHGVVAEEGVDAQLVTRYDRLAQAVGEAVDVKPWQWRRRARARRALDALEPGRERPAEAGRSTGVGS